MKHRKFSRKDHTKNKKPNKKTKLTILVFTITVGKLFSLWNMVLNFVYVLYFINEGTSHVQHYKSEKYEETLGICNHNKRQQPAD